MKEAYSVKVFECQVTVGSSALSTSVSATIRTIASALSTSGRVLNAKSDPVLGESVRPTSSVKTMQPDKYNAAFSCFRKLIVNVCARGMVWL